MMSVFDCNCLLDYVILFFKQEFDGVFIGGDAKQATKPVESAKEEEDDEDSSSTSSFSECEDEDIPATTASQQQDSSTINISSFLFDHIFR